MSKPVARIPLFVTLAICLAFLAAGPIAQPAAYHAFADLSCFAGLCRAGDVLSNLGFAVVALWGFGILKRARPDTDAQRPGWLLFLSGLLLTAAGSAYYHLEPDNARLVWDRLPIALACAGLLAASAAEWRSDGDAGKAWYEAALLAMLAIGSVAWWVGTEKLGHGDLRPYLLMQVLPLVLVPLRQWLMRAPAAERAKVGCAVLLYVLAKGAELYDGALLTLLGGVSGHTLKHLLATIAAGVLVAYMRRNAERSRSVPAAMYS